MHNVETLCYPLESVGQQNPANNYLFLTWQISPAAAAINNNHVHRCIFLGLSKWSIVFQGTTESTLGKDSLISLIHHDLSDLGPLNVNYSCRVSEMNTLFVTSVCLCIGCSDAFEITRGQEW